MTRRWTLLLADASPTIRRLVELTFADEPFSMVAVSGGAAALREIAQHPPDLVIVDAALAEPDGYDVASFVKRSPALAHIPVVVLTDALQPADAARAAVAGCDAVITKPLDPPDLEWQVKHLLEAPGHPVIDDQSLADRFDAIDEELLRPAGAFSTRAGPGANSAPSVSHAPLGESGPILEHSFDREDDEFWESRYAPLRRVFQSFLDAATSPRARDAETGGKSVSPDGTELKPLRLEREPKDGPG